MPLAESEGKGTEKERGDFGGGRGESVGPSHCGRIIRIDADMCRNEVGVHEFQAQPAKHESRQFQVVDGEAMFVLLGIV